jgi:iron complex outermembrane receptor protein
MARVILPPALFLTLGSGELRAQAGGLEEIIVTATRRTENLQTVPMTVSVFSEQIIEEAGIENASDLAVLAPGLTVTVNNTPGSASFRIRGVGTSQTDVALEPSVGLFVDDVYLPRSTLAMSDFLDVERIEILHGPQGTLYGKNTNAGAISLYTRAPNIEEFEGYVETTLGNYDMRKVTGVASGPLADNLAYRVSASVHQRDGYFDNNAGDDINDADDWTVITQLLYEPSDSLRVLVKGIHVERDSRCCAADAVQGDSVILELAERGLPLEKNDPFDHEIAMNVTNEFEAEGNFLSAVIDLAGDWGALKSITAWSDGDGGASYDPDRSQLDVMAVMDATSDSGTLSQEIRFSADAGDAVSYQLGLFYFLAETKPNDGSPYVFLGEDFIDQANQQPDLGDLFPPNVPSIAFIAQPGDSLRSRVELENRTFAAFGQLTWHLTDAWRVTGGLRWTDEQKDADLFSEVDSTAISDLLAGFSFLSTVSTPIDDDFTRQSSDTSWLINSSYDLLEDTMLFASVATGSKSGGFNTVNGTPEQREFDDETTINYELGIRSTLLDARMRLNATLFLTEVDDYQFQQQLETGIGTRVSNQAEIEASGLDLELTLLPLPNLTLNAGLLYMHKYEITEGAQKGRDLAFTAEYSGTLSATFFLPLGDGAVYLRGDYSYMDDHLTSSDTTIAPRDIQDREQLNATIGWRNERWNLYAWGKNLTDEEYAGLTPATFPITSMDAYFLAPPRTYGATLRYTF